MRTYLFLLMLGFSASQLKADTVAFLSCDTLFTTDGKVYFIKYYGTANNKVEYTLCDDNSNQHYRLPVDKVLRVGENKSVVRAAKQRKRDPLEELARNAYLNAMVGSLSLPLIGTIGFIFMIIGAAKGEKALRKLKEAGSHPEEKTIRKNARKGIVISFMTIFSLIAFYLLILLLIF